MDEEKGRHVKTLPRGDAESERRPGLRPAGLAAARIAKPIVAKAGGGVLARLKADWAAAVGAELAACTWPAALGRDGALKLLTAPALALELQHRAPLVIERINNFLGRAAVARFVLIQGPLPLALPARRGRPPRIAGTDSPALAGIRDTELRAALAELGELVLAQARQR